MRPRISIWGSTRLPVRPSVTHWLVRGPSRDFFEQRKLSGNSIELLEKSKYGSLTANNLQTACNTPANNLQQATCNQIWQIFLCNFIFLPAFRQTHLCSNELVFMDLQSLYPSISKFSISSKSIHQSVCKHLITSNTTNCLHQKILSKRSTKY